MAEALTVSELADLVSRTTHVEKALIVRSLRHWTAAGALPSKGGAHTGVGHHREYDRGTVYLATVLNKLADMGLPLGILKQASDAVQELASGSHVYGIMGGRKITRKWAAKISADAPPVSDDMLRALASNRLWRDAIEGVQRVYAMFAPIAGANTKARPDVLFAKFVPAMMLASVLVDPTLEADLIVINLTKLFSRIAPL